MALISEVLSSVGFCHVERDGNVLVHHLAILIPFGEEHCSENHYPDVHHYVTSDPADSGGATLGPGPA